MHFKVSDYKKLTVSYELSANFDTPVQRKSMLHGTFHCLLAIIVTQSLIVANADTANSLPRNCFIVSLSGGQFSDQCEQRP